GPAPHCTGNMNAPTEVCIAVNGDEMTPPSSGSNVWQLGIPNVPAANDTGGFATRRTSVTWSNGPVKLCGNNGKQACTNQPFGAANNVSPLQQVFSADRGLDATGPVMQIALSEPGSTATGSPYALAAGSHTLNISVGLSLDFLDQP